MTWCDFHVTTRHFVLSAPPFCQKPLCWVGGSFGLVGVLENMAHRRLRHGGRRRKKSLHCCCAEVSWVSGLVSVSACLCLRVCACACMSVYFSCGEGEKWTAACCALPSCFKLLLLVAGFVLGFHLNWAYLFVVRLLRG